MNCQSCGLPMMTDEDHGGGRAENFYCKHCTDSAGNLKSREEVREGMIAFYMQSMGKSREEAEKEVDAYMATMPAWAGGGPMPSPTEPVVVAPEPVPGPAPAGPSVPASEPTAPGGGSAVTPPSAPASEPPPAPPPSTEEPSA